MATDRIERVMVQATQAGFYRNVYVERGTTFALISGSDFTAKWMVKVSADAPDMIKTTGAERRNRPGERLAASTFAPLPMPAKPGDTTTVKNTATGDQSVI